MPTHPSTISTPARSRPRKVPTPTSHSYLLIPPHPANHSPPLLRTYAPPSASARRPSRAQEPLKTLGNSASRNFFVLDTTFCLHARPPFGNLLGIANVTQLVEFHLAKVVVVGSNPIVRSIFMGV